MSPAAPPWPALRRAVLAWFDAQGRRLPFRGITDPYAILVSEAMAQQTQIGRAGAFWERFLAAFPTVEALAAASPADVVRAWRGLGYNRRAVNLRLAALAIVERHGGRLPDDRAALERLPGVGPYTARAVSVFAFGRRFGPVDVNVRRVLGRIVAGDAAAIPPAAMQRIADAAVPLARPQDWTAALMDLGATVCVARAPRCLECPVRRWCRYEGPAVVREGDTVRRTPFTATSRWLRGRVVDLLRDTAPGDWARVDGPIGVHGGQIVAETLRALAADGLVEIHPADPARARLPLA